MANLPYLSGNEDKVLGILKMYSRMGAYPLDATSVFNTKSDLLAYIAEPGSYAYPGQVVAVANGSVTDGTQDDDYSLYVIRSDRSVQEIGKNLTFSSLSDAEVFITGNPGAIRTGELVTVADDTNGYSLYMVRADSSLHRVSFESGDIPDVSWVNLQGKPASAVADIDDAVAKRHEHENKEALDYFSEDADSKPRYRNNKLAYVSDIAWNNVGDKPTTVAGYGITDVYDRTGADNAFVAKTDVADTPTANKLLKLDADAKIPSTILSGVIPIENIPHGALERCVVVADDEARFALTSTSVQLGDTVKVTATGKMYFVIDETKLNTEAGYEIYTAGSASSVAWSGVTGTPTTLGGYGITDAVKVSDVTATPEAGKLLKVNSEGVLPASITGNADTVDGKHATDFVAATDVVTTPAADKILKLDGNAKLPASITGDADTVDGKHATDFVAAGEVVTEAAPNKILKLDDNGMLPTSITGTAASAANVAWSGVQNKPTTLAGYGITDAASSSDITNVPTANKVLRLNSDAKLPADITGNAATASEVAWSGVQNKPTTLVGYGITDAYTAEQADGKFAKEADVTTVAEANKILKLDSNGELPANITGNAATASEVAWSGVQNKPTTVAGYGITDAYTAEQVDGKFVAQTEVVSTAAANKILKLDANAKLPANILSGTIPIENIPHGALERCVVVASDSARFALTNTMVQTGDTVKVTATGKMYFVIDDTKLGTEAGYEVYTAGTASSVAWSGVTGTPTTLAGYGITDAYTTEQADGKFTKEADVTTTATANKLLKLDANAKLPADITGNAATANAVPWSGVQNKPTTLAGYGITDAYTTEQADGKFVAKTEVVSTATANKLLTLNADAKLPADITGSAGSVAWANVTDKPASAVADIDDAVAKKHDHANKTELDKFGVDTDGKLTYDKTNVVAYVADLTSVIAVGSTAPANLPVGGLWLDTSAS